MRKNYIYGISEWIKWKIAVFKLLMCTGVSWLLYKFKPVQENRTLYLSCKAAYIRNRRL